MTPTLTLAALLALAPAQKKLAEVEYPPELPGGKSVVTDRSDEFLKSPIDLPADTTIAKEPPTIDFLYYPGQTYSGNPWSNWGDSIYANGKYYASIGDHLAPAGNAYVYEYDPAKKSLRQLVDLKKLLNLPDGHYAPGKIHTRLDMGSDGKVYFATHRGSTRVTTDQYHYKGDWVCRVDPESGKAEVVVQAPVSKHCIPNGMLDPKRLIFYGGTAPGSKDDTRGVVFFAYDCANDKLLYSGENGPKRYMMWSRSNGKLYYVPDEVGVGELMSFDPSKKNPKPEPVGTPIGMRAASDETDTGMIYTCSQEKGEQGSRLFSFNVKTEKSEVLGSLAVGSESYVASLDADSTGKYLYYVPGAHGGGDRDGTPVVQFNTETKKKKVIAFLAKFYQDKYAVTPKGTYSTALSDDGSTLFVTWNANRGSRHWDTCALTVIHIPESERE